MINHVNIESMTLGTIEAIEATDQDSVVSYLPLCHVAEKIFSLFLPMYVGYPVNFAESITTIQSDLREIAPSVFLGGAAHMGEAAIGHLHQHQGLQPPQAMAV